MNIQKLLLAFFIFSSLSLAVRAEIQDQGLSSTMAIIDKAIAGLNQKSEEATEIDPEAYENASAVIINLSRTLGVMGYSRLQCGEAEVLAEFTLRVQMMPDANRNAMRDAFQEGFDKSKEETPLLSQDDCDRLTRSRKRSEEKDEATAGAENDTAKADDAGTEETEEEISPEDPRFRHLRIAELSGQLAYKRKFCEDELTFNRDYNEYLESIPAEYREEAKTAYWNGYKHGKRLNKTFTREQC